MNFCWPEDRIIPDKLLGNFFFQILYQELTNEAINSQNRDEGEVKFASGSEAEVIGRERSGLTMTQCSTRRHITIIFDTAYVPNTKLVFTDDLHFLK